MTLADARESKETRSMLTLLLYEYCICILRVPACLSHMCIAYAQDYFALLLSLTSEIESVLHS